MRGRHLRKGRAPTRGCLGLSLQARAFGPRTVSLTPLTKANRGALWRSGILQQMIDVALELFHLGQEFGPRNFLHLQQEHGELSQR